jgi:tetratricopeptide (TPR) repeat protein
MPPQQPSVAESLFMRSQTGQVLRTTEFTALLADANLPVILRASAIQQQYRLAPEQRFAGPAGQPSTELAEALNAREPLLQLAATQAIAHLPLPKKPHLLTPLLQPLLQNRFRVIRVAAAQAFDSLNAKTTSPDATESFQDALSAAQAESAVAATNAAWRGEGRLNTALAHERHGAQAQAIADYQASIALDPYFEPSYINLAELYRHNGDMAQEQMLYSNAFRSLPNSALLHYSYALHLLRRKNHNEALTHTRQAVAQAPLNTEFAYLHLLLLDATGATREGLDWLMSQIRNYPNALQINALGLKLAGKLGDTQAQQRLVRAQNQ